MEEVGLPSCKDDIVESLLNHDDLGLLSALSVDGSLPALFLKIPRRLMELPRERVTAPSLVETCSASRLVFRRNSDEVRDCCTFWVGGGAEGVIGCEMARLARPFVRLGE